MFIILTSYFPFSESNLLNMHIFDSLKQFFVPTQNDILGAYEIK